MIQAKPSNSNMLYSILIECSSWLKSPTIPQWNIPHLKKRFIKEIENGNVYYFEKNSEIIRTVTITMIRVQGASIIGSYDLHRVQKILRRRIQ